MHDGPAHHQFCDADCAYKWVRYRHTIGVAHIVRMPPLMRSEYLKGRTIDQFISDTLLAKCEHNQS